MPERMTPGSAPQDGDPHVFWMRQALALAASVLYCTSPNPRVGAVIVRDGGVLGQGATQPAGGPHAEVCALPLKELGYTLLKRDTPVAVADIEGEFLRSKIEMNGCCGEKELIKLEAYTLVDYPIVVHLDLDVLVLKPLDSLFDLMLGRPVDAAVQAEIFMWKDKPAIRTIDAFFQQIW